MVDINKDQLGIIVGMLFGLASLVVSMYCLILSRRALRAARPYLKLSENDRSAGELDMWNPQGGLMQGRITLENMGSSTAHAIDVQITKNWTSKIWFMGTKIGLHNSTRQSLPAFEKMSVRVVFDGKLIRFTDLNESNAYYSSNPKGMIYGGPRDFKGPNRGLKWSVRIVYRDAAGTPYKTAVYFMGSRITRIVE